MHDQPNVPTGFCECGCGERTSTPRWSDASHGRVAGRPLRWIDGHQNRSNPDRLYVVAPASGCWEWQGARNQGYGVITLEGRSFLAHRLFYERHHGFLSGDLDHLCRNRACVNPAHLEPITRGENVRRGDVAKLDWGAVAEIRDRARQMNGSHRAIARILAPDYPVAERTLRQVLGGRRWPEAARPTGG